MTAVKITLERSADAPTDLRLGSLLVRMVDGVDDSVATLVYRYLPGALWQPEKKLWKMPHTPGAMSRVAEAIPKIREHGIEVVAGPITLAHTQPRQPERSDAPVPISAPFEPWQHQRQAFWFLRWAREHLGSALLDCGMRTGKTNIVLMDQAGLPADQRCSLVICPKAAIPVWTEHAAAFGDDVVSAEAVEDCSVAERVGRVEEVLERTHPTMAVIGWSVLERLDTKQKRRLRSVIGACGATVVADEVHYAKAPGGSRSMTLAFISRDAQMRIGASGTPLAHSPLDAYALFRYLDPGVFGSSFARFREDYAHMGGFGGNQVVGLHDLDDLARRMGPYTFRVTRDVLDLLPATHTDVVVRIGPKAADIYTSLRDEAVAELRSGTLMVGNPLAKLMRLAQAASGHLPRVRGSGPHDYEVIHTAKQEALVDLLKSCDEVEPWVVFGRFRYDIDVARRAAERAGRPVMEYSGRVKELDAWKRACEAGDGPVLACQIRSGGIAIDLTEARFCAYLSVGYSLDEFEQSVARIHGSRQTRPVAYYHIIARGTVDVAIRRALRLRKDVLKYVASMLLEAA